MSKVVKKLYFDLPGFGRVHSKAGGTLNTGGVKREAVVADTGVVGFGEEPAVPGVDFTLVMTKGLSIKALNDLTDINVTVQTDCGDTYVLAEAWISEPCSISGGEIPVKMEGLRCDEVS